MKSEDKEKLDTLVAADTSHIHEVFSIWSEVEDPLGTLRYALSNVSARGTALRLLVSLDDETKKSLLPDLVDLASVGHSDIALCRLVIKSLPRRWLIENIDSVVNSVLNHSEDDESYRRFAELARELDNQLLESLVKRARKSPDSDVREVAEDFGGSGP